MKQRQGSQIIIIIIIKLYYSAESATINKVTPLWSYSKSACLMGHLDEMGLIQTSIIQGAR